MGGRAGGGAGAGRGGGGGLRSLQSFDKVFAKAFEDNKFRIGVKPTIVGGSKGFYTLGITNAKTNSGRIDPFRTFTGNRAGVLKYANVLKNGGTVEQAYEATTGIKVKFK